MVIIQPLEVDLIVRLVVAAALGAGIGIEREIHGHPAGLRTHLLVALGSAVFTILSFHGFDDRNGASVDPTRIAAQVVSGIGFLGAGAIIKEGFSIRGLTTAASLWGTAAIGMAAALAVYAVAAAGTVIILISLWPLNPISERLEGIRAASARVDLEATSLAAIARARATLEEAGLEVTGLRTRRLAEGRYSAEATIRHGGSPLLYESLAAVGALDGVTVNAVAQGE